MLCSCQLLHPMPNEQPLSVACSQRWRETSAEKRELARLDNDLLQEVRQAAEVHRQASLGLLTVLSCCDGGVAAQPLQRSAVRRASVIALCYVAVQKPWLPGRCCRHKGTHS